VDDFQKKTKKERNDLQTTLNAKKKAKMVPQGIDPEIERQRRALMDKEIKDLDQKQKEKAEQEAAIQAMMDDITGLTSSLSTLEKERQQLRDTLSGMGMGQQ